MAILMEHLPLLTEIFALSGFLVDPVLTFGFHPVIGRMYARGRLCNDLSDILKAPGMSKVEGLDLHDDRADWKIDMNEPVPKACHERYGTVIDIGSLEHVFDTRQCMDNCMRMVRPGGHYLVHVPVNGFFAH